MSIGQGSVIVNQHNAGGFPFSTGSARNGLSVDATGRIVLGQDVGAVGNPAQLLNNREVPLNGFIFSMLSAGGVPFVAFNGTNRDWQIGDNTGATAGLFRNIGAGGNFEVALFDQFGTPRFIIPDPAAGIGQWNSDDFQGAVRITNAPNGSIAEMQGGGVLWSLAGLTSSANLTGATTGVFIGGDAFVFHFTNALTNNAGAAVGTLNNSPAAGDPTKWLKIDDNGVTRRFPTW
jgi:hypothetical protein